MAKQGYKIQDSIKGQTEDSVGRGWRRLVRARDYAHAHDPATNQHAKLYFDRIDLAENFDFDRVRLVAHYRWGYRAKDTVDFYTCSDFCSVLQKQIGYAHTDTVERAKQHLNTLGIKSQSTLARQITCHVCRRVVKKDGTVDDTNRIEFRNPNQIMENVPKRPFVPWHEKSAKAKAETLARWGLTEDPFTKTPVPYVAPKPVMFEITEDEYKELKDLRALRDAMKNVLDN